MWSEQDRGPADGKNGLAESCWTLLDRQSKSNPLPLRICLRGNGEFLNFQKKAFRVTRFSRVAPLPAWRAAGRGASQRNGGVQTLSRESRRERSSRSLQ